MLCLVETLKDRGFWINLSRRLVKIINSSLEFHFRECVHKRNLNISYFSCLGFAVANRLTSRVLFLYLSCHDLSSQYVSVFVFMFKLLLL